MRGNLSELSMLTAGVGLLLLFGLSFYQPVLEVSEVEKYEGAEVNVKGVVTGINPSSGHVFITISDGLKEVVVPVFNTSVGEVDPACLREGVELRVRGRVQWYVYRKGEQVVRQLEVVPGSGGELRC